MKDLGLGSRKKRDSFEEKDEIWAIFDRDEHPNFNEAIQICNSNKIRVARSNPCFEVWLILHKTDFDAPDTRHSFQAKLAELCPEYDSNGAKVPDCAALLQQLDDAENRAQEQLNRRIKEGDPFGCPSTNVFLLTQAIKAAADLSKK